MINIKINNKIKPFNKKISVDGDKSISIRWLLLASQATGKSRAYGILKSEDILSTITCLRKLGVKIKVNQKGRVVQYDIDESKTTTQNDCLRNVALQYINYWRFKCKSRGSF